MPRKKKRTTKSTIKKKATTSKAKKTQVKKVELKPIKKYYSKEGTYIVHPVSDMKKSQKFYETILELEKNYEAPPEMGWCEYKLPVKGVFLGLSVPREELIPANSLNISTSDLEGAKKVLDKKKIKTTDFMDIPDMISMFSFKDPDENNITFLGEPRLKSK
jgi:predicted enzyme related to lactoylglutathione lyase